MGVQRSASPRTPHPVPFRKRPHSRDFIIQSSLLMFSDYTILGVWMPDCPSCGPVPKPNRKPPISHTQGHLGYWKVCNAKIITFLRWRIEYACICNHLTKYHYRILFGQHGNHPKSWRVSTVSERWRVVKRLIRRGGGETNGEKRWSRCLRGWSFSSMYGDWVEVGVSVDSSSYV